MFNAKLLCALAGTAVTGYAVVSGAPLDPSPITTVHWGDGFTASGYTIAGEVTGTTITEIVTDDSNNSVETFAQTTTILVSGQSAPTAFPWTTSAVVTVAGAASTVVFVEDVPPFPDPAGLVLGYKGGPELASALGEAYDAAQGDDVTLWYATASVGQVLTIPPYGTTTLASAATYNVFGTEYTVADPAAPTAS